MHRNGEMLYSCWAGNLEMEKMDTDCEKECDKMSSCVGYSSGDLCYLYPSYTQKCPRGFELDGYANILEIAKTANDLVDAKVEGVYGYHCKAKQGTRQENFLNGLLQN